MIKQCIKNLLSLIPTKRLIVFESAPDLSDNTKAVFDEMIRRGFNDTYKMVWIVSKKHDRLPNIKNVSYCEKTKKSFKLKLFYYRLFAKALISCNDFLTTLRKGQKSFFLTHGTCVKSVRRYYNLPLTVDYMLVDGEGTRKMMAYEVAFDDTRAFALGYPRNDVLCQPPRDVRALFPNNPHEKVAVWYPTFRQHKNGLTATTKALPFLDDEEKAARLNALAKETGVLLVLKPHFAQDISKIKACNFSNILFITDDFFVENGITSYEFIAGCDALITDYSSVYFDFLLCDKPIGLTWEDYEEYKSTVNFAIDMDFCMQAGEKIYTLEDFALFLKNLAEGTDPLGAQRAEVSAWANYSKDGKSAARVTDFIVEKANI